MSKGKSAKRKRMREQKRARKRASFTATGNSKYAKKYRAACRGHFSPNSPFRSVEVVTEDGAS